MHINDEMMNSDDEERTQNVTRAVKHSSEFKTRTQFFFFFFLINGGHIF